MQFHYKVIKNSGEVEEGEQEAADRFSLARELHKKDLTIVSIVEASFRKRHLPSFVEGLMTHIGLRDKILFANNTSAMIKAGLSLVRALGVMERQSSNQNFKAVLKGLNNRIESGESLSVALKGYPNVFPPIFVAMTAAGEESGNLPEALSIVGTQLNKTYELRRKIRGAMMYPMIVMGAILVVGILMLMYLVPILSTTFKELNVPLPITTRIVIVVSDAIAGHPLLFVAAILALILVVWRGLKTDLGSRLAQKWVLKLPIIGELVKKANSAVTMRTMSSLINAGVSMLDALLITEDVLQNKHYKKILLDTAKKVGAGATLADSFSSRADLYPVLVGEMISVGEETGSLSEMLLKGAIFYEDEVEQATKNLSTIIEPLLMVVVGVAVGFFAIAMISPIYSLTSYI